MKLTDQQANGVYDLLVRLAGASNRAFHRESFINAVTTRDDCEYRFCGALGFGGKFFNMNGLWYVSADFFDLMNNEDMVIRINQVNGALYGLKAFYSALTTATVD